VRPWFCYCCCSQPVARALPEAAAKTLFQAFISCRLDYCNALLYGIIGNLFRRLQSIQNAAARILTGTRRRDHISPVLSRLHWLPVKQRVVFKLATIVFKSLRDETPSYLVDYCQLMADSGCRLLRSADANALTVREVTLGSKTGIFRWLVRKYGTVFLSHCDSLMLNSCNSNDF